MIASLTITDLGPIGEPEEITLPDPMGWTEISGHSESGKSTLVDAVALALWGLRSDGSPFDVDAIHDGADKCGVDLVNAAGTVISRTVTRKRSSTRRMTRNGVDQVFTSEADIAAQLKAIGTKAELARFVLAPMSFVPLLTRELGRPLRDLLTRVLPNADLRAKVAELMKLAELEIRAADPVDEPSAKQLLTATNRLRDNAVGEHNAARARVTTTATKGVTGPTEDQAKAANATLASLSTWDQYDHAVERYNVSLAHRETVEKNRAAIRARRTALGAKPECDPAALTEHRHTMRKLDDDVTAANRNAIDAERFKLVTAGHVEATRATHLRLKEAGDTCPTCNRGGWEKAVESVIVAEQAVETAKTAHTEADTAFDAVMADASKVRAALEAHRVAGEVLEAAWHRAAAWETENRGIGPEPEVPAAPTEPQAPQGERPTVAAVTQSRTTLADAQQAEGARKQAEREQLMAGQALTKATADLARAETEAKRVEALVAIVRRAPSEIARDQAAALGDLGPVTLRFPPPVNKETPAVELLIDGRQWWLASTGKQVLADLWLRAAVRRVAGLQSVPVVVDRCQDWSGEWPDLPGPIWLLRTTQTEMTVTALRDRRAA